MRPLIATPDGTVVAGNMRLRAVQELGWKEVPTVLAEMDEVLAKERALRDNGSWGDWAEQDLAELLTELSARGTDVGILGFDKDQVERLLALVSATAQGDDADFDPTPPTVPEMLVGDLLLLGPHRLVCGDSRQASTWSLLMESGEDAGILADAMWTDPPYGVDLAGVALPSRGEGLAIEGDLPHEVAPLLASVFPHANRWLKPGGPLYVAGPNGRTAVPFIEQIESVGWHLAQTLVWVKNSFVPGRADYHYQHEAIYYGWKPGASHQWLGALDQATAIDDEPDLGKLDRRELVELVKALRSARTTDVVREDKTRHNDLHPTMKPTGLIRQMLGNSTRRGDLVLDPFAGSGSTLVAAELMGRRVAAIELEPRFCDVVVRRWLDLDPLHAAQRVRDGRIEPVGISR